MQSLSLIAWVAGVGLLCTTLVMLVVLVAESVQRRQITLPVWILIALLPSGILSDIRPAVPRSIWWLVCTALSSAGLYAVYLISGRKDGTSKLAKARAKVRGKVLVHLALLTGAVIFLIPFVWLLGTSFKDEDQIFKYPPELIPTIQVRVPVNGTYCGLSSTHIQGRKERVVELSELESGAKRVRVLPGQPDSGKEMIVDTDHLTKIRKVGLRWENYTDALNYLPKPSIKGLLYLWNTIYLTVLCIAGTMISSSMVAYAFARLRWIGRDVFFGILLATMMIPGAVTMMPVFLIFRWLGWVDTLRPLWVPSFFGSAFSIFLLRQFFMTIPGELEEAAKIDGAGQLTTFVRIMLPQIKPALAAVTIMTFMGAWNNFMGPLIYISSPEKMPLAYALQLFQGQYGGEYCMLMAASTMVMLPVLIIFFFTQRYFIEGITLTGIKG